jgi:hypothetical protein
MLRGQVAAQFRLGHDLGEKRSATSWSRRRARFLVNVVASNPLPSIGMSKNHLNNRS